MENLTFNFWVENKKSEKRVYFAADLRQAFNKWLKTKEKSWLVYYSLEMIIRDFIATKNGGLNAVGDEKQFDNLYRILKLEYNKFRNEVV